MARRAEMERVAGDTPVEVVAGNTPVELIAAVRRHWRQDAR